MWPIIRHTHGKRKNTFWHRCVIEISLLIVRFLLKTIRKPFIAPLAPINERKMEVEKSFLATFFFTHNFVLPSNIY